MYKFAFFYCTKIAGYRLHAQYRGHKLKNLSKMHNKIGYNVIKIQGLSHPYYSGIAKANGRESQSCLGRVFNYKLGCLGVMKVLSCMDTRSHLELKCFEPVIWGFLVESGNTKGGSITVPLTSCLTGLESGVWQMTFFLFYLQNRLIQISQTGGQRYGDTCPFSIPWLSVLPLCYWGTW